MAIIPQKQLFSWKEIENLADLRRLSLVLKYLPDEALMQTLESQRSKGRDDYPVRAVWNSILAGIIYQHQSIQSLRRELMRNAELRQLCGFDLLKGIAAVPSANAYTNFLKQLSEHFELVEAIFYDLVEKARSCLPDFGKTIAADSKGIRSRSRRQSNKKYIDGRGEADADKGVKTYKGKRPDGSTWESIKSWFGFKLHLIVDADCIRIKISSNPRIFTPAARSSYMWKTIYKKRSGVERINSRLDESFGFEKRFIRGIKKMKLRCCLALMVILAMAYGRVKEKQPSKIRSLVQPAA